MTLSVEDGQLFYKLWLPLLDYVNEKCKVNKKVKKMESAKSLNPQEVKEIANVLWNDISLIDKYLNEKGRDVFLCPNAVIGGDNDYAVSQCDYIGWFSCSI